ncbi:hypothetical protein BU15DRAFT_67797 [Melanogaster broomeanus]|nr:hypothetical protein BU15DRAFT_67797 [Melanogaster broomeanus]
MGDRTVQIAEHRTTAEEHNALPGPATKRTTRRTPLRDPMPAGTTNRRGRELGGMRGPCCSCMTTYLRARRGSFRDRLLPPQENTSSFHPSPPPAHAIPRTDDTAPSSLRTLHPAALFLLSPSLRLLRVSQETGRSARELDPTRPSRNMVANNRDPYFNDQDSRTPPSAASVPFNAQQAGNPAASMLYQHMMNQMSAISNSVLEAWAERSWHSREAWVMWEVNALLWVCVGGWDPSKGIYVDPAMWMWI